MLRTPLIQEVPQHTLAIQGIKVAGMLQGRCVEPHPEIFVSLALS